VVLYGDEIGMVEDLGREGRMAVRTPMDWDAVAEQRRTPDSLLGFIRRLAHQRRETPELGWGASTLIESEPAALFAHRADWQDSTVYAVHNLSDEPVAAELDLGADATGVDDLLELREHRVEGGRLRVELGAYGYLWLRARP
jgi:glycosidase